jgi:hypothetical protein
VIRRVAALALLLPGLACQQVTNPHVVTQQTFSHAPGSMRVVAVMPFSASPGVVRDPETGVTAQEVADLIATFVADALAAEGVGVIPPSDMSLAFLNQNRAIPRLDPQAAVLVAAEKFGATSVVMGQVMRSRQRRVR